MLDLILSLHMCSFFSHNIKLACHIWMLHIKGYRLFMSATRIDDSLPTLLIWYSTIDFQLEKLNFRFSDGTVELVILNSTLAPKNNFKSFKIDVIFKFAEKFYHKDFNEQEMYYLISQLYHLCNSSWELSGYVYHFLIMSRIS